MHSLFIRLLTPLPFLTLIVLPAFSAESGIGLNPTALDYYVREPDLDYKYDVVKTIEEEDYKTCLLYTSPSPRDATLSRMPSSA